jgi:hypothetical protein
MRWVWGVWHAIWKKKEGLRDFGGEMWSKEAAWEALGTWKGNIKVDSKKVVWEGVYWINLGPDKDKGHFLAKTAMNLRVP